MHFYASRGWTCYALNLRGHHLSPPVDDWKEVGFTSYLEDVNTVATWMGKELVFIGHSMGGVLGQKYAEVRNPTKLILLHTAPPLSVIQKIDFDAFLKRGKEQGRVTQGGVVESDSDPQKLIGYMFDSGMPIEEFPPLPVKRALFRFGRKRPEGIRVPDNAVMNNGDVVCNARLW